MRHSPRAYSSSANCQPHILHLQPYAIVMAASESTRSGLSVAVIVPESGLLASAQGQKCCYSVAAVACTTIATDSGSLDLEPTPVAQAQPGSDSAGATSSTAAAEAMDYQPLHRLGHLLAAFHSTALYSLHIPFEHIIAEHL